MGRWCLVELVALAMSLLILFLMVSPIQAMVWEMVALPTGAGPIVLAIAQAAGQHWRWVLRAVGVVTEMSNFGGSSLPAPPMEMQGETGGTRESSVVPFGGELSWTSEMLGSPVGVAIFGLAAIGTLQVLSLLRSAAWLCAWVLWILGGFTRLVWKAARLFQYIGLGSWVRGDPRQEPEVIVEPVVKAAAVEAAADWWVTAPSDLLIERAFKDPSRSEPSSGAARRCLLVRNPTFPGASPDLRVRSGRYAGWTYAAALADADYMRQYVPAGTRPGMRALAAYERFIRLHAEAVAAGRNA